MYKFHALNNQKMISEKEWKSWSGNVTCHYLIGRYDQIDVRDAMVNISSFSWLSREREREYLTWLGWIAQNKHYKKSQKIKGKIIKKQKWKKAKTQNPQLYMHVR